ncbi:divergent polysaccharide deacetylase family protein [Devosia nitrariae]|uniref:Divergent polysaccharide deacetylase family protein n=1 Tax=Devosia nitrariae TaxID=2071872 RepID=A0ABQ5W349_9HYPH|nr:divergent polysaccharide deacetylase family protein [Devosia nitrariae]GLQ54330.1 hypothetical protein GCM10010862_15890 [Devosia nitrariae]
MADDLSAPLQSRTRRRREAQVRRASGGLPLARLGAALIVVILAVTGGWLIVFDDPGGGRPVAEAPIGTPHDGNSVAGQVAAAPGRATITPDPQQYPVAPGAAATATTPASGSVIEPGIDNPFGIDPDLVEESEHGPLPRSSAAGNTPFAAYKRPLDAPLAAGRPAVAVVVVGLGINEAGSVEAIDRLPDAVSLAFAPYGRALEDVAATARRAGHEIFLEIPLEPFDYPDNDPGPQTLLTGAEPRANLDKLFWLLSRFGGYAGVVNNMGARFTASGVDFAPVMEELGLRGLGYLDDGSSNRSLSAQLAAANKVPFSRADMTLDANPDSAAILSALADLEARARQSGGAIGVISALPVSIRTVSEWAQTLEAKNITLVPASALMK